MSRRRTQPLEMALHNRLAIYMTKLEDIWNEIGISDRSIASRGETALGHLEKMMEAMVNEEICLKNNIETSLRNYTKEISQLRAQLDITDDSHDISSTSGLRSGDYQTTHSSNNLSNGILFKEKAAKALLRNLKEVADNRKREMEMLWEREKHFCQQLSIPFSSSKISYEDLSVRVIDSIKERVETFEETYTFRNTLFHQLRGKIVEKLKLYELKPNDEFTRKIVEASNTSLFPLSEENIDKMTVKLENIESTKRKLQTDLMKKKIQNLWKQLKIPHIQQNAFSIKYFGQDVNDATLNALTSEFEHLQVCYLTRIKDLVASTRKELLVAREEYFLQETLEDTISPDGNKRSTDGEELESLQRELELVNELGQQRLPVTTYLKSFKNCIDRMCFLEKSNNDKSRLKNRGGALLAEEKERNQMKKQTEKLKKNILDAVEEWKRHHGGEEFYVNGLQPNSFFAKQWERLSSLKGKINQQRQTRKQKEIRKEMRFGSKNPNTTKQSNCKSHNIQGKYKSDSSQLMPWGNLCAEPIKSSLDKGNNAKTVNEVQCSSNNLLGTRKLKRRSKSWSDLSSASMHNEKSDWMPHSLNSVKRRKLEKPASSKQCTLTGEKKNFAYSETFNSDLSESMQNQPRTNETLNSQIAPEDEFKGLLSTILKEEPKSRSSVIVVSTSRFKSYET